MLEEPVGWVYQIVRIGKVSDHCFTSTSGNGHISYFVLIWAYFVLFCLITAFTQCKDKFKLGAFTAKEL